MAFSITVQAPILRELTVTPRTIFLEVGRFSLFGNLWDVPMTGPFLEVSRWHAGGGFEIRLGPLLLSAGIERRHNLTYLAAE